ncbi:methyl-accepting chemotaxis protein [Aquibacillus rhizosphaerae]|uniref:Methyl-accepting chemotaxis protein n=1 Tax=Aquibacillus rhizosphaerae TaxID=3051431 RepID=A0ABT7L0P4_9BACI|nr:methyl-accepting chemotaxis protein [Aquibacillus sp. LR5S19]MDL4839353.1 methyl-accepting chemotaxis protein [Aquibacillus sp. LR5S19]
MKKLVKSIRMNRKEKVNKDNGKNKRKIIRFKSIKARILFGFSIVIIFVICLGVIISIAQNSNKNSAEVIINEELPMLLADEKLLNNITERISLARAYILFGHGSDLDRFNKLTEESKLLEEEMLQSSESEEIQDLVEQNIILENFLRNKVFEVYDGGNEELARQNLKTVNLFSDRLMRGYRQLVDSRETSIINRGNQLITLANSSFFSGIIISFLVVLISLITAIIVSNMISKPIKRVSERMDLIANSDLSNEPLVSNASDEIGVLVNATNKVNQNLKVLIAEISDVSESVSTQSGQLTLATIEVKEGSNQIASTMQELSSGADSQANHASELATSMTNFTEKIHQANDSGEIIYKSSQHVIGLSDEGKRSMDSSISQMGTIDKIVQDAVVKVKGLDQQSQKITKLVGVIKDIADQTNLLALNAAIEAARAGEHGKGFAVVADEVRKLAEQVSLSVTDITQIVKSIQNETTSVTESLTVGYKEVEGGMSQIVSTGDTFEQINQSLIEMAEGIKTISTNLSGIASNSEDMNKAVEEIAAVSEESAAGIEQTSASVQQTGSSMEEVATSSNELASLTERLNSLIARFKLKL